MRVLKTTLCRDMHEAFSAIAAAESLGFGTVMIRGDRCPLAERVNDGGEVTEEEWETHCTQHDHVPEFVVLVTEVFIPDGLAEDIGEAVETTLMRNDINPDDHSVYVPKDDDDGPSPS